MIEPVPLYFWAAMPLVTAAGAGLLAAILTRAQMAAALARQQQLLSEARALLATQHRAMEERVRATEETARRKALDEFLGDVSVEERQFQHATHKALIVAERVCFRTVPLTPWIEREVAAAAALPEAGRELAAAAAPARLITSPRRAS